MKEIVKDVYVSRAQADGKGDLKMALAMVNGGMEVGELILEPCLRATSLRGLQGEEDYT